MSRPPPCYSAYLSLIVIVCYFSMRDVHHVLLNVNDHANIYAQNMQCDYMVGKLIGGMGRRANVFTKTRT